LFDIDDSNKPLKPFFSFLVGLEKRDERERERERESERKKQFIINVYLAI